MDEPEPVVFGDPVLLLGPRGEPRPWNGARAASDPWESYPGMWQIAVKHPGNDRVNFEQLANVRKAKVPDAILGLLVNDP